MGIRPFWADRRGGPTGKHAILPKIPYFPISGYQVAYRSRPDGEGDASAAVQRLAQLRCSEHARGQSMLWEVRRVPAVAVDRQRLLRVAAIPLDARGTCLPQQAGERGAPAPRADYADRHRADYSHTCLH